MSEVLLVNPRKRKRRKRARARRNPSGIFAANPRRRRRRPSSRRVHRYRRNPRGFADVLMPVGVGITGALAADLALGLLPLPVAFQTPAMRPLLKAGVAVGLSMVVGQFVSKGFARKMMMGALTVVAYNTAKGFIRQAVPALPLGEATTDYPFMDYQDPRLDHRTGAQFYDDDDMYQGELIDVPSSMGELIEDETY